MAFDMMDGISMLKDPGTGIFKPMFLISSPNFYKYSIKGPEKRTEKRCRNEEKQK